LQEIKLIDHTFLQKQILANPRKRQQNKGAQDTSRATLPRAANVLDSRRFIVLVGNNEVARAAGLLNVAAILRCVILVGEAALGGRFDFEPIGVEPRTRDMLARLKRSPIAEPVAASIHNEASRTADRGPEALYFRTKGPSRPPSGARRLRSSMWRRQANYWESAAASKIEKRRDAPRLLQSDRRRIQPLSRELLKM
jgi:hypothetical protein